MIEERLILRAFEQAKAKGKESWWRMQVSVLKNRLLDITERQFDERNYGALDFREFLRRFPNLLALDFSSSSYPYVELIASARQRLAQEAQTAISGIPETHAGGVLRRDLRDAVLSYQSNTRYAWDEARRCVRPAITADAIILPKIDSELSQQWREEFSKTLGLSSDDARAPRVAQWVRGDLPRKLLPNTIKKRWTKFLDGAVEEFVASWIAGASIQQDEDGGENLASAYLEQGNNLAAGELYFLRLDRADEDSCQAAFTNACASWASPTRAPDHLQRIDDLIQIMDRFDPELLSRAVVHATWRFRDLDLELGPSFSDLAFRLVEPIREIYELPRKLSARETVNAAVARTEREYGELVNRVAAFTRSTAVTAKAASIRVLRQMHKYSVYALSAERSLLHEIDVLVGPIFRKFCEGCERRQPAVISSRGTELRAHIQRLEETNDSDAPGRLAATVINPTIDCVSRLVAEGTRQGEAQSTPAIRIVGDTIKLDLTGENPERTFLARLRNDGQGKANGVQVIKVDNADRAVVQLSDEFAHIDVEAGVDRIVRLKLAVSGSPKTLSVPIRLECTTSDGRTCRFDQVLKFLQQKQQPDWAALLARPPYAINPIKRRKDLYGRDSDLNDLELHVAGGTSTFLWGQKRVGKTSILQVLAAEINKKPNATCIILRMGEISSLHEGQIAHTIAMRFAEQIDGGYDVPPAEHFGAGLGRLVPVIERLCQVYPDHQFALVIDEFDDLDPAFYTGERGKQFVKALRSLSEVGLTFFFVGSERMDVIYREHAADLNKWTNMSLDRIGSEDDCAALIIEPVAGSIEYDSEATRTIVEYCRGNPFYMHLICSALFRKCSQEQRTFIGPSDLEFVRRDLLRSLGPSSFAHFWEDNPVLSSSEKLRQAAENCLFLTLVASLRGSYSHIEDLRDAQDTWLLTGAQRAPVEKLREIESRLTRRRVLEHKGGNAGGFQLALPMFADWLFEYSESQLLPIWAGYCKDAAADGDEQDHPQISLIDYHPFLIPEDDLFPISEKLKYLGKHVDVAELRRWLKQFDDDSRIEIAFLLLKRLAEQGFISEGAVSAAYTTMQESIAAKRQSIGDRTWQVIRGRLDNLCITYVDSDVKSGAGTARELAKRMRPGKCSSSSDLRSWLQSHIDRDPVLVVVDDFSGSGNTLAKGIKRLLESYADLVPRLAAERRIVCCVQTALPEAQQKIATEFPQVDLVVIRMLGDEIRAFDENACIFETKEEIRFAQDVLLQIGRQLSPQQPLGYGDIGALVAFYNTVPNNTLPAFWCDGKVNGKEWRALLPRASFG